MTLDELTQIYLCDQPNDHPRMRRRAFRCVLAEAPQYIADLEDMTPEQAQEMMYERVKSRYRQKYGFVGITLLMILGAIVLAAIGWLVQRILDKLFPERELKALALAAESYQETALESDEP